MRLRQVSSAPAAGSKYALGGGLGHGYPPPLEVLAQAGDQLLQAAQLQLGHALLAAAGTLDAGAQLVRRRHHHGWLWWSDLGGSGPWWLGVGLICVWGRPGRRRDAAAPATDERADAWRIEGGIGVSARGRAAGWR